MKNLLQELKESKNVRSNLSSLRQMVKEDASRKEALTFFEENGGLLESFLEQEDAKTRKNAALLVGDLGMSELAKVLYQGYKKETTLFVKASYLQALALLDAEELLDDLKADLLNLQQQEVTEENKKHVDEEMRALRAILIQYEGIDAHKVDYKGKQVTALLICNRNLRENVKNMVTCGKAEVHPMGVLVETDCLEELLTIRAFREVVFPLPKKGLIPGSPEDAAKAIWNAGIMDLLTGLHQGEGSFYYRIECKNSMELEQRSTFTKKLSAALDRISKGALVNSTGDYEVEIRLIANKEGNYFPCVKLYTLPDKRFTYRKNAIASSIHPSTAALMMEVAEKYLKEDAQIMDPFCGVGTMLIERHKKLAAKEIYGTDIFGDAIIGARENAQLAGVRVNYIHRDFMDFAHDYLFDEIITNMPIRGKKTKPEMDEFYGEFFKKAQEILKQNAIMILYTNEMGFVKKYLRLHKEYQLLQEVVMQPKTDFNMVIIRYHK